MTRRSSGGGVSRDFDNGSDDIEQCSAQAAASGKPTDHEIRRVCSPKGA
jgi:hypothetical protein